MTYSRHFSTKRTPQSEPIPGKDMAKDDAGGYAFAVDDWKQLERFLILGAEGGTYYVSERKLTVRNAKAAAKCLKEDGQRVVEMVVDISVAHRAPSNDPALFVLAMAASPSFADSQTRLRALSVLPEVARIGTHWFHFAREVDQLRGWGRGLREGVARLYTEADVDRTAYQCVKYQARDGWSHRDLLRLSHPVPSTKEHDRLFEWITQGKLRNKTPQIVHGYEAAKVAGSDKEIVKLIRDYGLTREMIPTSFLGSKAVWAELLVHMPVMAMIRNLGKMSNIGLLVPMSDASRTVVDRLQSEKSITRSGVHPLQVLLALKTYQMGRGMRGSLTWTPVSQVIDALDAAFYTAFGNVERTGKRIMLGLDVSGSMGSAIAGMPLSCREAAAAMSMVIARAEPNYVVVIFSTAGVDYEGTSRGGYSGSGVSTFDISPRERLDDIVRRTAGLPFGGTDCSLPMRYALSKGYDVDAFIVITDNETWAGDIHPVQALQKYRREKGIPAKLVTVGMTSSGFSIADPNDAGMLDCVGFDTATPNVISDFVAN